MSAPRRTDAHQIAATTANAAQQLELLHEAALLRLKEWQSGTRGHAYDVVGSGLERCWDRTCDECEHPDSEYRDDWEHTHPRQGGDPTGAAAFQQARVDRMLGDYRRDVNTFDKAALALLDTYRALFPSGDKGSPADPTDWCNHHLAELKACEPRYRGDLCNFCWSYQIDTGGLPPREILKLRHERGPAALTTKAVADANKNRRGRK